MSLLNDTGDHKGRNYSYMDGILGNIYKSIVDLKEREYFSIHEVRYHYILKKIQSLLSRDENKILDIGVYPPHLFHALKELGYEVCGIASEHEKVKDKTIKTLNIEKDTFPFHRASFDLVLMTEVIEHLTGSPFIYLSEIKRVLKPGGVLLITTPNAVHLKNRMKVLFGKSASFSIEQLFETKPHDGSIYYRHNREFTMKELQYILERAGFSVLESEYFSAYTPARTHRDMSVVKQIAFSITRLIPSLKDSLSLVAEVTNDRR